MKLSRIVCIAILSLLVSSCYSRPPPSIGWGYAVGQPILYEHPYYPYYWSGYVPEYWSGYGSYYLDGNSPYYRVPLSYTPGYDRINATGAITVTHK